MANRTERLLARLARRGFLQSVEKYIKEKGMKFNKFKRSVEVTDKLIGKVKARVGDTPIVVFSVGKKERFRMISRKNNIVFLGDMGEKVVEEESKIGSMRLRDGTHWDEKAHLVCGKILAEELRKRDLGQK
ncbi:MAG: hypothetical protein A2Z72_06210 [Omnitrophica bacterium RBG_13_46_9]|nr:MAG: hypothetical protein A2Z72_06210 [Omnitrophica bacterium RBG_13_46_9]